MRTTVKMCSFPIRCPPEDEYKIPKSKLRQRLRKERGSHKHRSVNIPRFPRDDPVIREMRKILERSVFLFHLLFSNIISERNYSSRELQKISRMEKRKLWILPFLRKEEYQEFYRVGDERRFVSIARHRGPDEAY